MLTFFTSASKSFCILLRSINLFSGGGCNGPITDQTLGPKFGWWHIPFAERSHPNKMFAECLFPPACLGAPNIQLSKKYYDESQTDLASKSSKTLNITHACNSLSSFGFRNHSRLCHTCAKNYRRSGTDECSKCPEQAANWGLMFLGFLMIMGGVIFIAGTAISSAGNQEISESIQKILLNYFQVAAMARIFPLKWPDEVNELFAFQGAFSTVGDHLVNPDCVTSSATAAELFYSKQAFFACLPLVVVLVSFVVWYIYGIIKGIPFCKKRANPDASTPKDYFIITVGAVLYLLFPTLIAGTFKNFDCRTIGSSVWLHADLEEECYTGRHQVMVGLLGVSQLIVYVFGLPCLMLWFLIRNKDRLDEHVVQCRYGLFFAGYKQERFYWETILSLRKIAIVALGVFGPGLGAVRQSQIALLVLLICILLEYGGDPFNILTPRHRILPRLELSALLVEFLTMWCGTMIFSSIETNDTTFVHILSLFVVLMISSMVVWLFSQLAKECLHEQRESSAAKKIMRLKKRMSAAMKRSSTTAGMKEDVARTNLSEIQLHVRTWSQPNNPALNIEIEKNIDKSGFMVAPPPAPVRIPEVEPERTESERIESERIESERIESERIRRGRVKSVEARHQKGDNRDVAYMNPMKKLREKRKNKDKGNPTVHF